MNLQLLRLLNSALPVLIALYKQLRDANPNDPAMTDDFIVELLRTDSQRVVDKANEWLAAHP